MGTETLTPLEELVKAGEFCGRYTGNDNSGNAKTDYLTKLIEMDDEKLYAETTSKIWLSAYASNNPRSDYHWHCDATYDEWVRRNGNADMYGKAHKEVSSGI